MDIEKKFLETVKRYKIASKKENIIVGVSGGKDSAVTAFLLKKYGYNIEGIYLDLGVPCYGGECLKSAEELCKKIGIPLHVYSLKKEQGKTIKFYWDKNEQLGHCAVCGVFKKWVMNKAARELNADKFATGHNLDDEAQTFLMNILKGSPELSANTGPITTNINDKKFVPRIKPLFFVPEKEIRKYAVSKKLPFNSEICPYRQDAYRTEVRNFVNTLSDKDKLNILKNLEESKKKLVKNRDTNVQYCEICGEPARGKVCKRCKLIQ